MGRTNVKTRPGKHHLDPKWALDQLSDDSEVKWRELFEHGTLKVEIYAPEGHDPQQPHRFDEVYVVISGSGYFRNGDERHRFNPGDLMFVPAGTEHRFEDFTADFSTWVMFYGPEGGE
jgi:mannose-6-phosphate isomerase-like protein (cupin superfamily)